MTKESSEQEISGIYLANPVWVKGTRSIYDIKRKNVSLLTGNSLLAGFGKKLYLANDIDGFDHAKRSGLIEIVPEHIVKEGKKLEKEVLDWVVHEFVKDSNDFSFIINLPSLCYEMFIASSLHSLLYGSWLKFHTVKMALEKMLKYDVAHKKELELLHKAVKGYNQLELSTMKATYTDKEYFRQIKKVLALAEYDEGSRALFSLGRVKKLGRKVSNAVKEIDKTTTKILKSAVGSIFLTGLGIAIGVFASVTSAGISLVGIVPAIRKIFGIEAAGAPFNPILLNEEQVVKASNLEVWSEYEKSMDFIKNHDYGKFGYTREGIAFKGFGVEISEDDMLSMFQNYMDEFIKLSKNEKLNREDVVNGAILKSCVKHFDTIPSYSEVISFSTEEAIKYQLLKKIAWSTLLADFGRGTNDAQ